MIYSKHNFNSFSEILYFKKSRPSSVWIPNSSVPKHSPSFSPVCLRGSLISKTYIARAVIFTVVIRSFVCFLIEEKIFPSGRSYTSKYRISRVKQFRCLPPSDPQALVHHGKGNPSYCFHTNPLGESFCMCMSLHLYDVCGYMEINVLH